ncbi:hypothetical protein RsTz2092_03260 [Deferribacterales bacterium RsTz2092]
MHIHHIGYLVKDIGAAEAEFTHLGYIPEDSRTCDNARGVEISFWLKDGIRVELISPVSESSPIFGLLKKYKNTPYHICYETNNLSSKIKELCQLGGVWYGYEES